MPEQFEHLLSGAVQDASRAANTPGAAAARARGRRLRNQRRVTAAALSLTMLAGAGTAAAVTLGRDHNGVPSAVSTATVTTSGPTEASSPSVSASAAPSDTSASPSQPSSTGTTPSGSQSSAKVPTSGTLVAGAWLSPSQLPFGTGYQGAWQTTESVGTLLGDSVYQQNEPIVGCNEDMRGSALYAALSKGLSGEQHRLFTNQGIWVTSQAIAAYPSQETMFYPSASDAADAWNRLPTAFAGCEHQMDGTDPTTGMTLTGSVQQTLDKGDEACWSTLAKPATSSSTQNPEGTVMHACFVRSGSLITLVTVLIHQDDSFSTVSFGSIDSATTSALRQALGAYGAGS